MYKVFPIENGDIPASYVSLPEGINLLHLRCSPPAIFAQEQFMRDTGLAAHSAEHSWR